LKIIQFINLMENQTGKKMKTLRTDNGLEFINKELRQFLDQKGIKHEKTCAYSPQQNGRAERENRTLVEAARTLLHSSRLDKSFWAEAINFTVFTLNRVGKSSQVNKTPFELWSNRSFNLNFLKQFGSPVSVHIPKERRTKLDAKRKRGILVGYSEEVKGYRVYFSSSSSS